MVHGKSGPVIVNGSEGESASGKDTVLLTHVPHLVLDGAVITARALASREVIVRVPASRPTVIAILQAAIGQRHDGIRITVSPGEDSFIAGEATAVISSLQGGPSKPVALGKPPTMRKGLRSRPVMLSNVETYARLALAVRGHTGLSSLVTMSGAVLDSGVMELPTATPLGHVLQSTGADPELAALITGGWHGTWIRPDDARLSAPTNREAFRSAGWHWGAGALIAIPHDPCPVDVLHAITDYLVGEGARQCGPCVLGLESARDDLAASRQVTDRVTGRGLCAHPTATIAAIRSGQALLAEELAAHRSGLCTNVGSRS
jgi:NADH:ubiquinone oxidoreductase subunit F (NADH-binding)